MHDIISKDPRIDSHIFFIDGDKQTLPKIIFVKENVAKTLAQPIIRSFGFRSDETLFYRGIC